MSQNLLLETYAPELEKTLKHYRFLRGGRRNQLDDFFSRLPEPYQTFAKLRYVESKTMEQIAEEMNYSLRSMYVFRRKILDWWFLFQRQEI
ncbi:MAG: hypothetical protein QHH75_11925 [Bacillota bacterium]|nr:hypothetical protein [Bacillota bacterium]